MSTLRLICAVPNPGEPGFPRSLLYPDTPEGHAQAETFAQEQNRPGYGVFECIGRLRGDATLADVISILRANGIKA